MNNHSSYLVEIIIMIGYLATMVTIGLVFKRFNKDTGDYFRNGCKGTWWLVGSSVFMAAFSAWTFTGAAGLAFEAGATMLVIYIANSVFLFLNFLVFAAWFRQLRAVTTPEVLELRFGSKTRQFYAWVNVVMYLIYSALFLYGLAIFSASVFQLDIHRTIIVIGVVVLLYTTLAGSWGVMAADFLQSLIMIPMTIVLAFICLKELGGFGGMMERIDSAGLQHDFALIKDPMKAAQAVTGYTVWWILAMFLKSGSVNISINSAVRFFAVKDGREARKAALLACILMTLGAVVWIIPPIAGRLLFAEEILAMDIAKPAESAYAVVSMNLLPNGLTGLMVVVIFMATVSSMDTGINRNSAIVVRDIYPAVCRLLGRGEVSTDHALTLSRFVNALFGLTVILLTLYFASIEGKGIFEFMLQLGALLSLPMSLPLVLGMFIKRAPRWSAMFSVLCGFISGAWGTLSGAEWNFTTSVLVNTTVGCGTFFLTMPFWKYSSEAYRKQVTGFFERMHTPVDFEKEVGAASDLSQLKVVGTFALTIGLLINLILLVHNSWEGRIYILLVSSFVAGIGALMRWAGARAVKRPIGSLPSTSPSSEVPPPSRPS